MVVGTPRANARLYPALVAEAARAAAPGAKLVAVTAARWLFERAIGDTPGWRLLHRIALRLPTRTADIHPCIYVCRRTSAPIESHR
jgi:hypothetical protein